MPAFKPGDKVRLMDTDITGYILDPQEHNISILDGEEKACLYEAPNIMNRGYWNYDDPRRPSMESMWKGPAWMLRGLDNASL